MKIALQKKNGAFHPFSKEDEEAIKDYKENQIVGATLTGVRKPRSVKQLRLFWACCRTVSNNTYDQNWNTPEKVCIQIKLALKFFTGAVVTPEGNVHFLLASIAFDNLNQVMANNIFDQSWNIMAKKIGVTVDELLINSERNYS